MFRAVMRESVEAEGVLDMRGMIPGECDGGVEDDAMVTSPS